MNYYERLDEIRNVVDVKLEEDGETVQIHHPPSGAILRSAGHDMQENLRRGLFELVFHLYPRFRNELTDNLDVLRNGWRERTALLVGGGPSGEDWPELYEMLTSRDGRPPVVITMNGCSQDPKLVEHSDFHLALECDPNKDGNMPAWQWIPMPNTIVLMNWRLAHPEWIGACPDILEGYRKHCRRLMLVERSNGDYGPPEDNVRESRHGLWYGPFLGVPGIPPLGTGACQLPHLAGLIGCREAHSCGFDLCLRDDAAHHWYRDELYNDPNGRKPSWEVIEHDGLKTFEWWRQSAYYLAGLRWLWWQQGLHWHDHSCGLLQKCGFWMMGSKDEVNAVGGDLVR